MSQEEAQGNVGKELKRAILRPLRVDKSPRRAALNGKVGPTSICVWYLAAGGCCLAAAGWYRVAWSACHATSRRGHDLAGAMEHNHAAASSAITIKYREHGGIPRRPQYRLVLALGARTRRRLLVFRLQSSCCLQVLHQVVPTMLHRQVFYQVVCDYPGCRDRGNSPASRFLNRDECQRTALEAGWIRGTGNAWYCPQCKAKLYSQTIAAVPDDGPDRRETPDPWEDL